MRKVKKLIIESTTGKIKNREFENVSYEYISDNEIKIQGNSTITIRLTPYDRVITQN